MEKKYEVFVMNERIASDMRLDIALCLIRGWILENSDPDVDVRIKEMEKSKSA